MMSVFVWGLCSDGQLGLGGVDDQTVLSPRQLSDVEGAEKRRVVDVSCGVGHSLLLLDCGSVFSCGSDEFGQLGREGPWRRFRRVPGLDRVAQVRCGAAFSLAVSTEGGVLSWGCNDRRQLGREDTSDRALAPVVALGAHFVVEVACGAAHALCLTRHSQLLSWGANDSGQLGRAGGASPALVASLHAVSLRQVACGAASSFCLTVSGSVFSWGRNDLGQLGLGDTRSRDVPHPCPTLKTQPVVLVSCGEAHTAFLTRDGGVFTCGAGGNGQLGHGSRANVLVPTKVFEFMGRRVARLVCGRRHCMAVEEGGRLLTFGLGTSGQLGGGAPGDRLIPTAAERRWGEARWPRVFAGPLADAAFLVGEGEEPDWGRVGIATLESVGEACLGVQACVNASFLLRDHFNLTSRHHGLDLDRFQQLFADMATPSDNALRALLQLVPRQRNFASAECLRVFLVLPLAFPLARQLVAPYCRAVNLLDTAPRTYLLRWFRLVPLRFLRRAVVEIRGRAAEALRESAAGEPAAARQQLAKPVSCAEVMSLLQALKLLHNANKERPESLSGDVFYMAHLSDTVDVAAEYYHWYLRRHKDAHCQSLCDFPFIFDGVSKSLLLRMDAKMQMAKAMEKVHASNFFAFFNHTLVVDLPELVFRVRRDNILADTVTNLDMLNPFDLKKPLKVIFENEEAQDEGGVRKEYLMLFFKQLMDPNFAMFKYYEESRMLWFHEHTFEDPRRFAMVGTMCGLSIYNSSLVDLNFPLALYKKLLARPLSLDDLKELDPVVGRSLQALLDYEEEDLEDVFCLNFSIERDYFGERVVIPLKERGADCPVTLANKAEYVDCYLDFVFNVSCKAQYKEFNDAFHNVFASNSESLLSLFEPCELQTMLVGNEQYDWECLRRNTTYKGEFWSGHPVIAWFWEVFDDFSSSEKKKFLLFLTGNDRVPMQGMGGIKLYIQPNGADKEHLPVAHTCFNLLDLPKYPSKAELSQKLKLAIEHSEGFGLV